MKKSRIALVSVAIAFVFAAIYVEAKKIGTRTSTITRCRGGKCRRSTTSRNNCCRNSAAKGQQKRSGKKPSCRGGRCPRG